MRTQESEFIAGKTLRLTRSTSNRRDALLAEVVNLRGEISREYDLSRLEAKLRELGTEKDSEIYRQVKFGYYWREIGENVKEHPNTVYRRFSRLLKKVRDAI